MVGGNRSSGGREWKRQRWSGHIRAWSESGRSQAQYCREHGLKPGLFSYWKRRIEEPSPCDVELVPVGMHPIRFYSPGEMSSTPLVLHIGQYRVEVGDGFDPATLARLVSTLERI
ncbi:MAG: transposase [Deltaproteobacteria bacterium]|nr:transposase [Deltaproteobacteria bacterium]MDX9763191.1 hypothetical protein [Desulfomonilia bacterium]